MPSRSTEQAAVYQKRWYEKHKQRHIANVAKRRRSIKAANKLKISQYLSEHPCVVCGEADPVVLDFDHVSGVKVAAVGDLLNQQEAWEVIYSEIQKCDVRCANCHRRKTAKEQGWTR